MQLAPFTRQPVTAVLLLLLLAVAACGSSVPSVAITEAEAVEWLAPEVTLEPETIKYIAGQALSHVGRQVTVCGTVADTNYASFSNGSPTFLNFDKPHPRNKFTVVIWGSDRSQFPSSPESFYRNKRVCANGLIEIFNGKAQIIARTESQLVIIDP